MRANKGVATMTIGLVIVAIIVIAGIGIGIYYATLPAPTVTTTTTTTTTTTAAPTTTTTTTAAPTTTTTTTTTPPETVTITVWHRFSEEEASVYETFIETFEEEHPNIKVNFEFVPGELMWDRVTTAIAGGAGPDLFEWAHDWTGKLAIGDYIAPIDDFVTTELREKFVESALKAGEYEGHLYALPWAAETTLVAYNMKLMGDRPIPETTDELVALMAEFKENGLYGASYPINTYMVSSWILGLGGHIWDDETKTVGVNSPETKAAVEWLVEKFKPYLYEDLGWDAQVALFPEDLAPSN